MTVSLKHTFQSAKDDSADATLVQPSNWNQEHVLTAAAGKVLGRDTSSDGTVQELPISVTSAGNVTIPNNFAVTGTTTLTTALGVASGGTGLATLTANNVLIGNGTSAVTSVAPGTAGNLLTSNGTSWVSAISTSGVAFPQNIQSADYTLVLTDAGKQIFHPAADANIRTYTIPANASVAFPIGTVVLFTVENGGTQVSVAITSDTLVFGNGTTGAIFVPPNNTLMAIKVTATKWMANYLYQTGSPANNAIAVAHLTSPFVTAYTWSSSGFGAKYADPATLPTGSAYGVAFSPSGNTIAVAHSTSIFITAYPWSGSGFGTKYGNPATLPTGGGIGVAFSPAGNAIAVAHGGITAYPWSTSGFGTKYTDPATLPGSSNGVAFNPAGTSIAVAHNTTPFITAYPWNAGTGFGTKYTNPATLPTDQGFSVAFSPAGDAIAVAHQTTPFITAYPWNAGTGFGTKYTNPATLPTDTGRGVAFSPAGDAIAVAHANSPRITAYPWSGSGFGTKFTNPATLPAGDGNGVAFSRTGDAIAVAHTTSPFVTAYPWSGSGFGTKYANPASLPTGQGNGVAFTFSA
jgi:WD40 repeat protein